MKFAWRLVIETFEKFCSKYQLYYLLDEAIESEKAGEFWDYDDFIVYLTIRFLLTQVAMR